MPEDRKAKCLERLNSLNNRKLDKQKSMNEIEAQIRKVKKDIHAEDVKRLDVICAEKGISYEDICSFLEAVNMPLSEIAARLNPRAGRIRTVEEIHSNNEEDDHHE